MGEEASIEVCRREFGSELRTGLSFICGFVGRFRCVAACETGLARRERSGGKV